MATGNNFTFALFNGLKKLVIRPRNNSNRDDHVKKKVKLLCDIILRKRQFRNAWNTRHFCNVRRMRPCSVAVRKDYRSL